MKKLISLLMILTVLFSLCACGGQTKNPTTEPSVYPTEEVTEAPTEEKLTGSLTYTPEQLYGHIDQTKPNDEGVYKLWSKDGVANMENDPAGTFELLCNIDMEGAVLSPIGSTEKPFTGKIDGKNFIISNFTLTSEGEALGFVGVNEGTIQDLQLEGVNATATVANKYIGTFAGVNKSIVLRSKSSGTLTVETAAADAEIGGAIGQNTGDFTNSTVTVDVLVSAADKATVGGLVGTTNGGKVEYVDSYGAITVTGQNKTVALFAGTMENTPITGCIFVGADNSLNGELFTNLTNTSDMSIVTGCSMRDNTPVEISDAAQKLRDIVVDRFNEMCSIEWRVRETLEHESGVWSVGTTYYGAPYKHRNASLASIYYMIDDEGYIEDFVYDMDSRLIQSYLGNDCDRAVADAWWAVSNSTPFRETKETYPFQGFGCLPVGGWEPDPSLATTNTPLHIAYNGVEKMYECYAQIKKGDIYSYSSYDVTGTAGHTRMAAANAVVVRDQNGKIDPNYSYVTSTEQGWTTNDTTNRTYTTCRVNYNYTFANLMYDYALPMTCEELLTGEMEPATWEFTGGQPGYAGMSCGIVKTNYYLDSVILVIKDSTGNEVFNHVMFTSVGTVGDASQTCTREYYDTFNVGRFATPLAEMHFQLGETYSYTISAHITPGETFVVHESSFTYGSAE